MNTFTAIAVALLLTAANFDRASAAPAEPGVKIFSADFEPRAVDQVEIGDFHFTAGQPAPIHTHEAPVLGYVSKGSIYFQVEGQKPQIVKAGEAFYEPVGPRILHFDNASPTEECVFTDFNLERPGEPFIVFPSPPTAKIDRRTFPTSKLHGTLVNEVNVYAESVPAGRDLKPGLRDLPVFGYVAKGSISMQIGDGPKRIVETGQTYFEPAGTDITSFANVSTDSAAKVVNFYLTRK